MKLNREGHLARFYLAAGDSSLPDDFCSFFWGLVGRIIKCLFGLGLLLLFAGLVMWALFRTGKAAWNHKLIAGIVTVVATALVLGIRRKKRFEFAHEVGKVIDTKIDAVKNRYCPRIEWQRGSND